MPCVVVSHQPEGPARWRSSGYLRCGKHCYSTVWPSLHVTLLTLQLQVAGIVVMRLPPQYGAVYLGLSASSRLSSMSKLTRPAPVCVSLHNCSMLFRLGPAACTVNTCIFTVTIYTCYKQMLSVPPVCVSGPCYCCLGQVQGEKGG